VHHGVLKSKNRVEQVGSVSRREWLVGVTVVRDNRHGCVVAGNVRGMRVLVKIRAPRRPSLRALDLNFQGSTHVFGRISW